MYQISTTRHVNELISKLHVCAPHWVPIFRLARGAGLVVMQVVQGDKSAFWRPEQYEPGRPWLVALADDTGRSRGPAGFHRRSVMRLFRDCAYVTINAADEHPEPYMIAGMAGVLHGQPSVLIETRVEHQEQWISMAQRCGVSDGQMLIVSPTGHRPANLGDHIDLGPLSPLPVSTVN